MSQAPGGSFRQFHVSLHVSICLFQGDRAHVDSFWHPMLCPIVSKGHMCPYYKAELHRSLFQHKRVCKHGSHCKQRKEANHVALFTHPKNCSMGARCDDASTKHNDEFCHPVRHGRGFVVQCLCLTCFRISVLTVSPVAKGCMAVPCAIFRNHAMQAPFAICCTMRCVAFLFITTTSA